MLPDGGLRGRHPPALAALWARKHAGYRMPLPSMSQIQYNATI